VEQWRYSIGFAPFFFGTILAEIIIE